MKFKFYDIFIKVLNLQWNLKISRYLQDCSEFQLFVEFNHIFSV